MQLDQQKKAKEVVKKRRTITGPNPERGLKANEFVRIAVVEGKEIVIGKVKQKKKLKK